MCRIETLRLNSGEEYYDYNFSLTNYVFGKNTVGKTAMSLTLDTVLGKTENKAFNYEDCLKNIDSIEVKLTKKDFVKWFKRDRLNNFYIKDGEDGGYQQVDINFYKNEIEKFYGVSDKYKDVYEQVFGEKLSFRSFSFLNFIDEGDAGNLFMVFTRSKNLEHLFRIKNIMQMLFNYANIFKIFEKEHELIKIQKEIDKVKFSSETYNYNDKIVKDVFNKLNLEYKSDYQENYQTFLSFNLNFSRDKVKNSKNYMKLLKESLSLSEEIKILEFREAHSNDLKSRNNKINKLLNVFSSLLYDNKDYSSYVDTLKKYMQKKEEDNIILSAVDYSESLNKLKDYKNKIDLELAKLNNQPNELGLKETLQYIGVLDNAFAQMSKNKEYVDLKKLEKTKDLISKEIKRLKNNFDETMSKNFNAELTSIYLNDKLNIKCILDDLKNDKFSIIYDPIRISIRQTREEDNNVDIASKSRMTLIQILCYIEFFKIIREQFDGLCVLPLLVLDGVSLQFDDSFYDVFQYYTNLTNYIGIQTITFSLNKIEKDERFKYIDISKGFNPFYNKK